jgi:hypothetical protein
MPSQTRCTRWRCGPCKPAFLSALLLQGGSQPPTLLRHSWSDLLRHRWQINGGFDLGVPNHFQQVQHVALPNHRYSNDSPTPESAITSRSASSPTFRRLNGVSPASTHPRGGVTKARITLVALPGRNSIVVLLTDPRADGSLNERMNRPIAIDSPKVTSQGSTSSSSSSSAYKSASYSSPTDTSAEVERCSPTHRLLPPQER